MEENVILYTTGCPKCNVLKQKLAAKNVTFEENTSVKEMLALGFAQAPMLKVGDEMLDFKAAVAWANNL